MSRTVNIVVDASQDLLLNDTLYPAGTTDADIDTGRATPDDITARAYQCIIHQRFGDATPLLTYSTGGGGMVIPTGTDGLIQTTIPLADLLALGAGNFVYYIRRTDSGQAAVVTRGTFTVDVI